MMKIILKYPFLFFALLLIIAGCNEECDDCLQLTQKEIRYIDSNGTNLLFGDLAIHDPDNLVIKVHNNETLPVWKQEINGTILFQLEQNYSEYYIVLPDTFIDTLEFELAERKSTECCGNVTYSTKTFLNGLQIENKDWLIITH